MNVPEDVTIPRTEAGRRAVRWFNSQAYRDMQRFDPLIHRELVRVMTEQVIAIEVEAAEQREAELRDLGWVDADALAEWG